MRKQPAKAKSEDSPAYISTPAHAALPSHADALLALEGMPTAWVVQYAIERSTVRICLRFPAGDILSELFLFWR